MTLVRKPFVTTRLDEERANDRGKVLSVRLNDQELARLEDDARLLRQEKPATALKQLAELGSIVLHDPLLAAFREVVFNNQRRNERLGIAEADPRFKQK